MEDSDVEFCGPRGMPVLVDDGGESDVEFIARGVWITQIRSPMWSLQFTGDSLMVGVRANASDNQSL